MKLKTILFFLLFTTVASAQEQAADLTEMSLEELMNIQVRVTSVARKEQDLFTAPAAIAVLTQTDIRRSGATSIPEVLRLVPGLHVARVDGNKWAITARGFSNLFANKLLVMIDGRSVYTPLFAGVYWDVQDLMLQDIDRIEVIRGPGASLWGANAVNGVINIITRRADLTQGGLVSGGGGTEEHGFGNIRYGGMIGEQTYYRVYGKYFNRDQGFLPNTFPPTLPVAADQWDILRGGFRMDRHDVRDTLTVQGDIYDGDAGQTSGLFNTATRTFDILTTTTTVSGGNLLARWNRSISERSDITLQTYYDRTKRSERLGTETRNTLDLDFQHRWGARSWYEAIWGVRYRFMADDIATAPPLTLTQSSRNVHLFSGFLQNEFTLADNRLYLTVGSKIEHNSFSDFEIQPSARVLVTPHPRHALWAAVSRAVRTPSRSEQGLNFVTNIPFGSSPPNFITIIGNRRQPEALLASELGYRVRPIDRFSLDTSFFYNRYNDLGTEEPAMPFFNATAPLPHVVVPINFFNNAEAEAYGAELVATWNVMPNWSLTGSYTGLNMDIRILSPVPNVTTSFKEGDSPQHQFHARSSLNLPRGTEIDALFWYIDALPAQGIGSYTRTDMRISWFLMRSLSMSLVGQNLFDEQHAEFGGALTGVVATQAERSVYARFTFRF